VVSVGDIETIFVKWCDARRELYAVVVAHKGIQTITGFVTGVKDGVATLTDTIVEVHLPIATHLDASFTRHDGDVRSVTLSWEDMSVFVVARM
jgi:hypothetical protein